MENHETRSAYDGGLIRQPTITAQELSDVAQFKPVDAPQPVDPSMEFILAALFPEGFRMLRLGLEGLMAKFQMGWRWWKRKEECWAG
ncbi:hypothetical protein Droror1_Dr00008413 [Drosera rotundifolia]